MNVESLEARQMLSGNGCRDGFAHDFRESFRLRKLLASSGVRQLGPVLYVNGTADDDAVNIYEDAAGVNVNNKYYSRVKLVIVSLGDGNDVLSFQLNNVSVVASGGVGDDFILGSVAKGNDLTVDGGSGSNFISVTAENSRRSGLVVNTGSDFDTITASGFDKALINSGDGDDTITVSAVKDLFVNAGAGKDSVSVDSAGRSIIFGGSGEDTIHISGTGDFLVIGGADLDVINSVNATPGRVTIIQ